MARGDDMPILLTLLLIFVVVVPWSVLFFPALLSLFWIVYLGGVEASISDGAFVIFLFSLTPLSFWFLGMLGDGYVNRSGIKVLSDGDGVFTRALFAVGLSLFATDICSVPFFEEVLSAIFQNSYAGSLSAVLVLTSRVVMWGAVSLFVVSLVSVLAKILCIVLFRTAVVAPYVNFEEVGIQQFFSTLRIPFFLLMASALSVIVLSALKNVVF